MASNTPTPHGGLLNSRTYWTWTETDKQGRSRQMTGATPPVGGSTGLGLGPIQTGIRATPAPDATQYHEYTYADGTKVLSRFDPQGGGGQGDWTQESVTVDPQIRAQYDESQKQGAAAGKPVEVGGKLVQPDGQGGYRQVWPPLEGPAGEKPVEVGGKLVQRQPDGTYKTVWAPPATTRGITRPELGATPDANALENEAQVFIDGLYADASLTDAERNRRYQEWYQTVFAPKVKAATDAANAKQAAAEAHARDVATRQVNLSQARATSAERMAQTEADRLALEQQKFVYGAGQDAVKNALALLPYAAGPTFASDLAGAYNTVLGAAGFRPGGSFSPGAFAIPTPNIDALADAGARRAMALASSSAFPRTAGAMAPAAPSPAVAAQIAQTPAAPPPPRAGVPPPVAPAAAAAPVMPDQPWWRPGDLSGTGATSAY